MNTMHEHIRKIIKNDDVDNFKDYVIRSKNIERYYLAESILLRYNCVKIFKHLIDTGYISQFDNANRMPVSEEILDMREQYLGESHSYRFPGVLHRNLPLLRKMITENRITVGGDDKHSTNKAIRKGFMGFIV